MGMTAYLIVRSNVPNPDDRPLFDAWYQKEHLPDAHKDLGVARAWRAWGTTDPSIHCAFYEFPDVKAAEQATAPEAIRHLIKEYDRVWGTRVTRTREIISVVQSMEKI